MSFTLPVNPDGLDSLGLDVVKAAVAAGVQIAHVNVMTMDYGSGTDVGAAALSSVDGTAAQLRSVVAGLGSAAAYAMVGATPMIGHNDDGEVFSLDDASTLAAYARSKGLGLLSFWAIERDEACPGALDLDRCSGVNSSTFQFSRSSPPSARSSAPQDLRRRRQPTSPMPKKPIARPPAALASGDGLPPMVQPQPPFPPPPEPPPPEPPPPPAVTMSSTVVVCVVDVPVAVTVNE